MKRRFALVLFWFGFLQAASPASAQIVVVPPGLAPGNQYRLVFVTSTTRDAVPTDVSVYNAFVTSAANSQPLLAALGTSWTAVASTLTVDARDNTGTNWTVVGEGFPFYRLDGLRVAPQNSYFWNMAFPEHTISYTELGTRTPVTEQSSTMSDAPWVWSGTQTGGTKTVSCYLGVNSGVCSGFPVAAVAYNDVTGPNSWLGLATSPILDVHALYGISGILTVPNMGLPGDYNGDTKVDALDYTVWRNNFGDANETDIHNNGDGGGVGEGDFTLWKQHYGDPGPGGGGMATGIPMPVPEPTTLFFRLLCVVYIWLLPRAEKSPVTPREVAPRWPQDDFHA